MEITEGCEPPASRRSSRPARPIPKAAPTRPFTTTITREDGEEDIAALDVILPRGLAATFAGIAHCEGAAAETGVCPPGSRIGKVVAAVGVGPAPLWVPQPGKRPTAVYLGGPYKGAPHSIVAVVPKQAGPFDFGDEVVRTRDLRRPGNSPSDGASRPLPQFVEGTPLHYRTISVQLDRPDFALNPTSCAHKETSPPSPPPRQAGTPVLPPPTRRPAARRLGF